MDDEDPWAEVEDDGIEAGAYDRAIAEGRRRGDRVGQGIGVQAHGQAGFDAGTSNRVPGRLRPMINVGDKAPDFELPDQYGRAVKLSDFKGTPQRLDDLDAICI